MVYVFLIFMIGAGSNADKHIIPMQDMAQCQAALSANKLYDNDYDNDHWGSTAKIYAPRCVEIKR